MIGVFDAAGCQDDQGYATLRVGDRTFVPLPEGHVTLAGIGNEDQCMVGDRVFVDVRKLLDSPPATWLSIYLLRLQLAGLL